MATTQDFERLIQPCLDAGYNLARWLMADDAAAEDALQEASLRAFSYLHALTGPDARPWFLKIVRHTCYSQLSRHSAQSERYGFDEEALGHMQFAQGQFSSDPAQALAQQRERHLVNAAIAALPPSMREVIVLREIEGLDYKDISHIAGIPMGTVMSRLSRARAHLRGILSKQGLLE